MHPAVVLAKRSVQMKKQLLFLAVLSLVYLNSFSQIIFEKGYFIDESGQKTDCFIKNIDWKDNPTAFQYKLSENGEVNTATIKTTKEFRVDGSFKYVRAKVKIDRSLDDLSNLSNERNPTFKEEILFLKTVVDGKATLYSYEDGNLTRFFYKLPDKEIDPLVYKLYKFGAQVIQNNAFKQELSQRLTCQALDKYDFEKLNYNKRDLERLFVRYNKCSDPNYVNPATTTKRNLFNLTVRPGLSVADIAMRNLYLHYFNTDFNNKLGFRFGVETEYILPFNKNKWAILAEPTFQYSPEQSINTYSVYGVVAVNIDYKSIEFPVGLRYYIFPGGNSNFFVNVLCVLDVSFNSSIKFSKTDGSDLYSPVKIGSGFFPAVGAGYKFKNKYGVEIRYQMNHDILFHNPGEANYSSTVFILGYTF